MRGIFKYEPPVKIKRWSYFSDAIAIKEEEAVMAQIKVALDVSVDKEELVKALNYDRDQYTKGFEDAICQCNDKIEKLEQALDKACKVLAEDDDEYACFVYETDEYGDENMVLRTFNDWKEWLL